MFFFLPITSLSVPKQISLLAAALFLRPRFRIRISCGPWSLLLTTTAPCCHYVACPNPIRLPLLVPAVLLYSLTRLSRPELFPYLSPFRPQIDLTFLSPFQPLAFKSLSPQPFTEQSNFTKTHDTHTHTCDITRARIRTRTGTRTHHTHTADPP